MTLEELAAFKPNRGRLHPETKVLVESLNARGLSMKQIAEHLGVSWPTVRSWKAKGYFTLCGSDAQSDLRCRRLRSGSRLSWDV